MLNLQWLNVQTVQLSVLDSRVSNPAAMLNPAVTAPVTANQMSYPERKHWSKALAKLLRHQIGNSSNPPRSATLAQILQMVHASHQYGNFTEAKFWEAIQGNHRFTAVQTTADDSGWWQWLVRAL